MENVTNGYTWSFSADVHWLLSDDFDPFLVNTEGIICSGFSVMYVPYVYCLVR